MNVKLRIKDQLIEVELCNTFKKRLLGFMFQRKKITTGKCFPHCNSIHTFFMFQKIDLLVCDSNFKVIARYENFKQNHILWPISKAYYILELPLGRIQKIQIGDQLILEKRKEGKPNQKALI